MRTILFSLLLSKKRKVFVSSLFIAFGLFFLLEASVHVQAILDHKLSWILKMPEVDLWIANPKMNSLFSSPLISREVVLKMRMLPEVKSASPLFVGRTKMKGEGQILHLGIDETTLLGAPAELVLEKDKRGVLEKGFFLKGTEPLLYTSYRQAMEEYPEIRQGSPFILIKLEEGKNCSKAAQKIEQLTHCKTYSKKAFAQLIFSSILQKEPFLAPFFSLILLLGFFTLFLNMYFLVDAFAYECSLLQSLGGSLSTLLCTFLTLTFLPTVMGYLLAVMLFGIKCMIVSSSFPNPLILLLSLVFSLLLATGIGVNGALKAQRRIS